MITDFFYRQLNHMAGILAIGVLFAVTAFSANLEIKDLDLWLHVRTGQYIIEHGAIPNHDVLSCTISGKPWVNHEWLFQVIVSLVHRVYDFDGLITMQVIVVCITFLVLLLTVYRSNRQWLCVFTMIMLLMIYQSRFTIRPDIFSLLFFAAYMAVLMHHLNKRWSMPVLAVIQLLWVNMHGFFIFGPILSGIFLVAELIKRSIPLPYDWNTAGRLNDQELQNLGRIVMIVTGACFINPYFIEGATYPFKVLFQTSSDSKVFFKNIYELQKPISMDNWWQIQENGYYKVLVLVSAVSFFFNRRKMDIRLFLVWMLLLVFSLAAIRNMIFFAAGSMLVIVLNSRFIALEEIVPINFKSLRFKELTGVIAKAAIIIWMLNLWGTLANRGYFDFDTLERKSEYGGVSKRSFPYKAVDFLKANHVKGNFFNDFNSGAYLIGRVHPNIKVFIDGRTEVYGGAFFTEYQKIWGKGDEHAFQKAQKKFKLTGALINDANQQAPPRTLRLFYKQKDWKPVYFDDDGMIFLKDVPQNKSLISKFGIDLKKWQPPALDLQQLGPKRIYPFPHLDRARMLMALKLEEPALKEMDAAVKINPDAHEIYRMRGDIYARQRKYKKAFENFRIAAMYVGDRHNRMGLAYCYERLGKNDLALKQYNRLLEVYPKDVKIIDKINKLKAKMAKK